jgi:lambda family phage minor tail protein L
MSTEPPIVVITELQKLEPDAFIELFQLDCSIFGGAVYLFHNQRVQGTGTIQLGGQTYQPIGMEANGFALNGTEQAPTPTITISSVGGVIQSLITEFDDLVGARVRRIRTFRKFLDDGSEPDSTARISDDVYFVNRKTGDVKEAVTFELDSSLSVDGVMIPNRKILGRCQAQFKDGVNCPYVGADSSCLKKVTDCAAKFGADAVLPFMGFPAVERISLTI